MQIVTLLIVLCVVFKMLMEYESPYQKIKRMDNNPSCTLKSDKWKREHGLL